ncbi:alpha/beta-hydrolase [Artomyces pyxidatus]|uniref:Alpha/beta-hydrolase n=1 Tax=Artomyces pyxidatus TaxID=48021 RepID=A0ACB8TD38_9AGAM|nr:alpha/beta-hydrolase [Artomyces pyxidatus]
MALNAALATMASGRQIFVQKYDPEYAAGADIPVLFIHGMAGRHTAWGPVLPFFPARTRIVYDLHGHGRTPSNGPATPATLAEDARDILVHFGIHTKVDVIAHSGGCVPALAFAATYPRSVRRLALLGPPPIPVPHEMMAANMGLIKANGMRGVLAVQKTFFGPNTKSAAAYQVLEEDTQAQRVDGVLAFCDALIAFVVGVVHAEKALIVYGTEDPVSSKAGAQVLAYKIGGTVVEVGGGHWFMLENPLQLGEELRKFLDH